MDKGYHSMKSSKKGIERFGAPLIVVLGAPTFMSAWVLLFDDKEPIHERYEWKRGIARRKARRRAWSALERRHLCRHGFCYSMIKNLSTNGTNGKGVSLEEKLEERLRALWSADI